MSTFRHLEELSRQLQTGLARIILIKILRFMYIMTITDIKQKYAGFPPTETNYGLDNERQIFENWASSGCPQHFREHFS